VSTARADGDITNFTQFYALSTNDASANKHFVYEGVLLCYDRDWNQMFLAEGSEAKYLPARSVHLQAEPKEGDSVRLVGDITFDANQAVLTNLALSILGTGTLPNPKRISLADLPGTVGQWVEFEGEVRIADAGTGKLELAFYEMGQNCTAFVMGPNGFDAESLAGGRVRIRGINTSQIENGQLATRTIILPGTNEIVILDSPQRKLADLPVISIGDLRESAVGEWTNEMVHINGWIEEYRPGEYLVLRDPTGMIPAELSQTTPAELGERADVWGFASQSPDGMRLKTACFTLQNPASEQERGAGVAESPTARATNGLDTITTAAALRALSPEQAGRGYPVRLRGVVTYADSKWGSCFIEDKTDACWARLKQDDIKPGDFVELTGQTDPGDFAPVVLNANMTFLRHTNLPKSIKADLEDAADGHLDSRLIKTSGVVRRVQLDSTAHLKIEVAGDREKFTAIVPEWNRPVPADWVDARVSISGVCAADVNRRRQLEGITIFVPEVSRIKLIEAAPSDPFAIPVTPIASLATFSPGRTGKRVAVQGVLTMLLPGRSFVLQDQTGGIRVQADETNQVRVGDNVQAVGFLALGDFSPHLESALCRREGPGTLPIARAVTADGILRAGTYDKTVVEIRAVLVQKVIRSLEPKLVLQDGTLTFTANLRDPSQSDAVVKLAPGSLLLLTGVCLMEGNPVHGAENFHLALSRPGAVKLLKAPPSLTAQDFLKIAGAAGLVAAAALTWIGSLRRQVRTQTKIIRNNQEQLLQASRQAGMAEVATAVLHNVGNVLNSVNISTTVISDKVKQSKATNLAKVAGMLKKNENHLAEYLAQNPKGRQIPVYLKQLSERLAADEDFIRNEVVSLEKNVEHIKSIVAMQQDYAKGAGYTEKVRADELVEDALRLNLTALSRHQVEIRREYAPKLPELSTDKHKVLQVLVNLIQNAKHACDDSNCPDKKMTLRVNNGDGRVRISVIDSGIGIPAENLTKIFNHGFTTRENGHGFGLHSGALAARQLGGSLSAHSDGPGKGATFTLELPVSKPAA
jgi:signal transduction histidine kinase